MKDLVQIIRDNPGCVAVVDNDCWALYRVSPSKNPHNFDSSKWDAWVEENSLAESEDVIPLGEGYGSGNCYGGDILQALAVVAGIKVESV